jgi:DNA-binding NtrC family response regulator
LPISNVPTPVQAQQVAATATASPTNTQGKRSDLVGRTVEEVEKELIIDTLSHCLGNRTQAAQILGISIRTLRNKLKQYGGDSEMPRTGSY